MFEIPIKGAHSNHNRQKKLKETQKNDENYQISRIFGTEANFCNKNSQKYIKILKYISAERQF